MPNVSSVLEFLDLYCCRTRQRIAQNSGSSNGKCQKLAKSDRGGIKDPPNVIEVAA